MLDGTDKLNMIEHMVSMYASNIVTMPANGLYDEAQLQSIGNVIDTCHIYFVGMVPRLSITDFKISGGYLVIDVVIGNDGQQRSVKFSAPPAGFVAKKDEGYYFLEYEGKRYSPPDTMAIGAAIGSQIYPLGYKVLYIGQAYGEKGERNASDRLKSHSTLQKIALEHSSDTHILQLILISLDQGQLITTMNPLAQDTSVASSQTRIRAGISTIFDLTEKQKVSLYEAAMIRYFQPKYNKLLKDSFPSTNMKLLESCYRQDLQGLVAEFNFDPPDFFYQLFSDTQATAQSHIARYDLHDDENRKSFFRNI